MDENQKYIDEAIDYAFEGVRNSSGGPFGAIIVKNGQVIAKAHNRVVELNDPTAHAEILAIREACQKLNSFQLNDCTLYTSTEPCPMCLGAIYWARPEKVYFSTDRDDAAKAGFDDNFIYDEINKSNEERKIKFIKVSSKKSSELLEFWKNKADKKEY